MLGGPFTEPGGGASWETPPPVVRMVAVLVAIALVVMSALRSRRRALLPWLFLAAYLTIDLTLVAATRLGVVGTDIATDPRFLADVVPVAILCAMFAFLPAGEPHPPEQPQTRVVVGGVAVVLVAGAIASLLQLAPALQFRDARDYVANARAALREHPGMILFDGPVPNDIMIEWFLDDATTSRVIGLVPEHPRFDRPAEHLYQLDSSGNPRPIRELTTDETALPGPVKGCGYLVEDGVVRIPLRHEVSGRKIVRIGYYTSDPSPGSVEVGDHSFPVQFNHGLHAIHVVVSGTFAEVSVSRNLDVSPMCVTDVRVGLPPS
jgi:hypothetical protein